MKYQINLRGWGHIWQSWRLEYVHLISTVCTNVGLWPSMHIFSNTGGYSAPYIIAKYDIILVITYVINIACGNLWMMGSSPDLVFLCPGQSNNDRNINLIYWIYVQKCQYILYMLLAWTFLQYLKYIRWWEFNVNSVEKSEMSIQGFLPLRYSPKFVGVSNQLYFGSGCNYYTMH